mmetsp:Transcript_5424/g.11075  ORF Transcript_5424/g.11075 Transcript_5424/m.11075 type:complete len:307 (+) Transcript_5424:21-941(+)
MLNNRRRSERSRAAALTCSRVVARISLAGLSSHPPVRIENLRRCKSLTVYTVGSRVDGRILADLIRQCDQVERIHVERKDNDWDAQETSYVLDQVATVANGLRQHSTLQEFSLEGITDTPLDDLAEALCAIPSLTCVTLKADHVHRYTSATATQQQPIQSLLSVTSLNTLLGHATQRLSLAGLFPEANEYQQALFRAFVRDHSVVHIYIHFAGATQLSPFCYFLRHVMQINQQNREPYDMTNLLQYVAKRQHFSLDAAFWLMRENPWLCEQRDKTSGTGRRGTKKKGRWNMFWRRRESDRLSQFSS